jgi:hypothetical protein
VNGNIYSLPPVVCIFDREKMNNEKTMDNLAVIVWCDWKNMVIVGYRKLKMYSI